MVRLKSKLRQVQRKVLPWSIVGKTVLMIARAAADEMGWSAYPGDAAVLMMHPEDPLEVVGALFIHRGRNEWILDRAWIHPDWRGQGLFREAWLLAREHFPGITIYSPETPRALELVRRHNLPVWVHPQDRPPVKIVPRIPQPRKAKRPRKRGCRVHEPMGVKEAIAAVRARRAGPF